jgi:putative glutamine amidotransferase
MMMAAATSPLIGINADFLAAGKQTRAQARLHAGYFDAVTAAGGLPVILPPLGTPDELEALLDRLDGFILSGGLDMDPRRLGRMTHQQLRPMAARREENDLILVKSLIERRMPTLGIGLGMQQVNVALGGNLFLHLPEDMPKAMPHLDPMGGAHRHIVFLESQTQLEEIYGGGELRVNSSHHQAVRNIGEGLRQGAKAPDGVIEAIESQDPNWFFIGVQWHPESDTASALDQQLFECFIQACLRQTQPLRVAA